MALTQRRETLDTPTEGRAKRTVRAAQAARAESWEFRFVGNGIRKWKYA